jgi:glycopeptide antibiotics resistance protein
LYAVYLVAVAYLVWTPQPAVPSGAVTDLTSLLNHLGLGVTTNPVEFGLNVLLFVPMSLLGSLLLPRLRVPDWVMVGFVASFVVEVVQRVLLPDRFGSTRDIVSNTLGALVGAVLAWGLARWTRLPEWFRAHAG